MDREQRAPGRDVIRVSQSCASTRVLTSAAYQNMPVDHDKNISFRLHAYYCCSSRAVVFKRYTLGNCESHVDLTRSFSVALHVAGERKNSRENVRIQMMSLNLRHSFFNSVADWKQPLAKLRFK